MILGGKRASLLLFLGDIAIFALALICAVILRTFSIPTGRELAAYWPFLGIFVLWALVFYMSGLYGKRVVFLKASLFDALLRTQLVNIIIAALIFFVLPLPIAPKTILVLYLVVSLTMIYLWRVALYPRLTRPHMLLRVVVIAAGEEADELVTEVNSHPRYGIAVVERWQPSALPDPETFAARLAELRASILVVDTDQAAARDVLPRIYELAHVERRYQFVEFENLYEEVFDRIPLSRLRYEWFLRNVSPVTSFLYSFAKRAVDLAGGVLMGIATLILFPFIAIANAIESPGPVLIRQERIGERGKRIHGYKFRSMRSVDQGMWPGEGDNRITKVGAFLRKTSLDEFPQFINILAGELSLIGPRNDLSALGERLASALPYYNARYLVRPGITGWAQINQQYEPGKISPQSVEETKVRLAYDFYYLKNRSFGLDLVIALKTVKRMFFRVTSW